MKAAAFLGHSILYNAYFPIRALFNSHQRKLLLFLITVLALCSASLAVFSIYLANLFYVENQPSSLLTWVGLSMVGIGLLIVCIIGLRGAYYINIELLLGFFWGVMVFLAPLIIGVITCFNVYQYIGIFYRHLWDMAPFEGLRKIFCSSGTANNLCAAPNKDRVAVTMWCSKHFNSTECFDIRETAIENAISTSSQFTLIQGIVGVFILGTTVMTIYLCFRILTKAVITESMNDVINYLLILPIAGCTGMAYYMWDWQFYQGLPYSWSAKMFISIAVCQAIALPFGIYAGRMKSQIMLSGYMVFILLIMTGMAIVGTYGLFYSQLIPVTFSPPVAETSYIACQKKMPDCCCCGHNFTDIYLSNTTAHTNLCPEWSKSDVITLLVLDLRVAGVVGLVCILYLVGALIVASLVNYSLRNYKSDFV